MSKLELSFIVRVPYEVTQKHFSEFIDQWVATHQPRMSAAEQAALTGLSSSDAFGILSLALSKGHGVSHVSDSAAKVLIPTSKTTYGGEMVITARAGGPGTTQIGISGHTQGLSGGPLRQHMESVKEYLARVLPNWASASNQISSPAGQLSLEIERLAELHEKGHLSAAEFEAAKHKILS
jgi:hypothetical protein